MDHYKLICVHYKHLNLQLWYTAPLYKMTCMVTWPNENSIRLGKWGMRLGNMHRSIYHWVLTLQKGFIPVPLSLPCPPPPPPNVYHSIFLHVYNLISSPLSQEWRAGCRFWLQEPSRAPSLCKDRRSATNQECQTLSCTPLMNRLIQVAHRGQGFRTYWHQYLQGPGHRVHLSVCSCHEVFHDSALLSSWGLGAQNQLLH